MQHRVIRMPDNTYNLSVLSRTLYAKVGIIIVYAIKITLKYIGLRHINTKKIPTPATESGFMFIGKGVRPPYSLKKIT